MTNLSEQTRLRQPKLRLCGLEGLPGSGKTTTCRHIPVEYVAWQASACVPPELYPPLLPDPCRKQRVSPDSIRDGIRFFISKEVSRTSEIRQRHVPLVVLDRTWHSQIVHNYALSCALGLSFALLEELYFELSALVDAGRLYFPDWLVTFRIPQQTSYRKVVRRDGRFFGRNMEEMLSVYERNLFLRARAIGYSALLGVRGISVVTLSYQAHPMEKVAAATNFPPNFVSPNPKTFFEDFLPRLIASFPGKEK
jgi:hypothetical protein